MLLDFYYQQFFLVEFFQQQFFLFSQKINFEDKIFVLFFGYGTFFFDLFRHI